MSDTLRARRVRHAQAILNSHSGHEALLGEADFTDGVRVLVLGERTAETLCALVHTECLSAEARGPDAAVRERSAELILVPQLGLRTLGRVVRQAAAAARPGAKLVVAVAAEHGFEAAAAREMAAAGFTAPCRITGCGQVRLVSRMIGDVWRRAGRGLI